jgi:C_GCAxxG_C_C family probable redox protein
MKIMKKRYHRRDFMYVGAVSAGSIILGSCSRKDNNTDKPDNDPTIIEGPDAMSLSKQMPKEQVFQLLDQKVNHYMEISHNCAQSTFLALSEQFGLGNKDMVKALTPIPGIAERGETCGAVTGALLALGLVFGRDNISDWQAYRNSLIPANEFCDRFVQEMGSTMCGDIVERKFGNRLDLRKTEDLRTFQESDATHKCSKVVQTATRIAAELILEA